MAQERNAERLVAFTDAVVAIAITLLILPLAEIGAGSADPPTIARQLMDDIGPVLGFTLSFFVIARLWWAHHRLFSAVERYSTPLVVLNFLWLFTIVLLPAATAFVPRYDPTRSPVPVLIYVGTMCASSVLITGLAAVVHLSADVAPSRGVATRSRLVGSAATAVAFGLALALGSLVPSVNYWAIWLIALTPPVEVAVNRRLARRDPGRPGRTSAGAATMNSTVGGPYESGSTPSGSTPPAVRQE